MEILVVVAVLVALIAIAVPIYKVFRQRAHKAVALTKIEKLGGAVINFANQNAGVLPQEDADGNDSWRNVGSPAAKDAWYNAAPRILGVKGAGDYANAPKDFYTDENILFSRALIIRTRRSSSLRFLRSPSTPSCSGTLRRARRSAPASIK